MTHVDTAHIAKAVLEGVRYLVPGADVALLTPDAVIATQLGLDSEDGVDLACYLQDALGFTIPHNVNPLVADDNGRGHYRTFGEVTALLSAICKGGRNSKDNE